MVAYKIALHYALLVIALPQYALLLPAVPSSSVAQPAPLPMLPTEFFNMCDLFVGDIAYICMATIALCF